MLVISREARLSFEAKEYLPRRRRTLPRGRAIAYGRVPLSPSDSSILPVPLLQAVRHFSPMTVVSGRAKMCKPFSFQSSTAPEPLAIPSHMTTGTVTMPESTPICGGCQCGSVRYAIDLKRLIAYACHCTECKKQSSSSFAVSVPIPAARFQLTGLTAVYRRATDSGTTTHCFFCPACGTRLYHHSERSPDIVTVKGGTLDEISVLPLVAHLWTKRKHAWITLPLDAEIYETQPDDLKQWRDHLIARLEAD